MREKRPEAIAEQIIRYALQLLRERIKDFEKGLRPKRVVGAEEAPVVYREIERTFFRTYFYISSVTDVPPRWLAINMYRVFPEYSAVPIVLVDPRFIQRVVEERLLYYCAVDLIAQIGALRFHWVIADFKIFDDIDTKKDKKEQERYEHSAWHPMRFPDIVPLLKEKFEEMETALLYSSVFSTFRTDEPFYLLDPEEERLLHVNEYWEKYRRLP